MILIIIVVIYISSKKFIALIIVTTIIRRNSLLFMFLLKFGNPFVGLEYLAIVFIMNLGILMLEFFSLEIKTTHKSNDIKVVVLDKHCSIWVQQPDLI